MYVYVYMYIYIYICVTCLTREYYRESPRDLASRDLGPKNAGCPVSHALCGRKKVGR